MNIVQKQQHEQHKKQQSHKTQLTSNRQSFVFSPVQTHKLKDIYHNIKKQQLEKNDQTMFPTNFSQVHSKELNTYLFEIEVGDLYKKWNIIKRLHELVQLKDYLQQKFPNQPLIFSFPIYQEDEINHQIESSILHLFCAFLNSISKNIQITKQKQFLLFIQNWVSEDKKKITTYFQRNLMKKAGGRHTESSFTRIMNNFVSWRHKFFTVASQGVYYTDNDESFSIKQMLPFNQSFSLLHGQIKTGYTYGLILNSCHRVLQVDAQNVFNFLLFIHFIKRIIHQSEQGNNHNRYNSFAKVRQNCSNTFYIDGKDYFENLYYELIKAKNQVFITGWFLTPHMYLKQSYQDFSYRIDKVLENLALKGVKVYIIVYNAPRIAIDINPEFTETYLTSLNSNIKVLRHPNYMFIPFLWSHHEKMVIIDYKVAFMGGLDIGYGRMDDSEHRLFDEQEKVWKGIDYCNYRIVDLTQIHVHEVCSIDRQSQPRLPWHDIGIRIVGKSVSDLCRHFVQYWNYANYQLYLTERQLMLFTGIHEEQLEANGLEDQRNTSGEEAKDKETNESNLKNKAEEKQHEAASIIIPQNQTKEMIPEIMEKNKITKDGLLITPPSISKSNSFILSSPDIPRFNLKRSFIKNIHQKNKNNFMSLIDSSPIKQFDRQQPELKKLMSSGPMIIHEDPKEMEIQYYLNFLKNEKSNNKPKMFEQQGIQQKGHKRESYMKKQQKNLHELTLKQDTQGSKQQIKTSFMIKEEPIINKHMQRHQILRSASLWSLGLKEGKQEKSILEAYLSLIENAKHFIYIENQFFISVQNQVSNKIASRILKAYQEKEVFKVMIVVPFLPGFPGEIESDSSAVFRVQLDLMYKTICRSQSSLLSQLSSIGNLQDYLSIYCLRNHGKINGMATTEIVYVHSKLMIVDDSIVLLGSANINDRSLMGDRDSEIGIVVEDGEEVEIGGDQQGKSEVPKIVVKKVPHQLRTKLYMQHFGLKRQEAQHFFNFKVWDQIQFNAQRNQKIYKKLFGCYPDDSIKCFADIQKLKQQAEPQRYQQLKLLIKGYACPFQTEFMQDQSLQLHSGQKEYYIPFINFT